MMENINARIKGSISFLLRNAFILSLKQTHNFTTMEWQRIDLEYTAYTVEIEQYKSETRVAMMDLQIST